MINRKNIIIGFLSLLVVFFLCLGRAAAQPVSSELQGKINNQGNESLDIIVTLKSQFNPRQFESYRYKMKRQLMIKSLKNNADISAKTIKNFLKRKNINNVTLLWATNSLSFRASPSVIGELAIMPEVASIRYDQILQIPVSPKTFIADAEFNLNMINAPGMWNLGFTGQGVVVAILDSGADIYHPDISGKWRGGANSWFDPYNHTAVPYDIDGHGTQATGIIVGGDNGGTTIGGSPDAKWIAAKIFSDAGQAPFSKIHLCFQWLLDPDGDPNTDDLPDIANNSWGVLNGVNQCVQEFYQDIELLKALDVVVVFAAGNDGPASSTSISPANYDNVISVGAVNSSKTIASFSSRGPSTCSQAIFPTFVSPGVNIKTSDLTSGGVFPQSYAYVSGTSFASPHVASAAALLKSAFPDVNAALIEEALVFSAEDLGTTGPDNNYGNGLIDVLAAYEFLKGELCYADLDQNGSVNLADISVMAGEWLSVSCPQCQSDLNSDQTVNMKDFTEFARQFAIPACR